MDGFQSWQITGDILSDKNCLPKVFSMKEFLAMCVDDAWPDIIWMVQNVSVGVSAAQEYQKDLY